MPSLEALQQFVESSPDDPLPRYALGMEYRNQSRLAEAADTFRAIAARWPDYVPTYLMLIQTLVTLGQTEEARAAAEDGVGAARRTGNRHALAELQDALDSLGD